MAVEAPIVTGVAGRYAVALFELAQEAGQLDQVAADLARLRALIEESADLRRLVRSPIYSREEQGRGMDAVMDRAGTGALVRRFVGLVASKRRLFVLPEMIQAYMALLAHHRGEVTAEAISAFPLDDAQMAALRDSLRAAVGREVKVNVKVDNALLGGMIVRVGSRMVDTSLRTKLASLRLALKEVG